MLSSTHLSQKVKVAASPSAARRVRSMASTSTPGTRMSATWAMTCTTNPLETCSLPLQQQLLAFRKTWPILLFTFAVVDFHSLLTFLSYYLLSFTYTPPQAPPQARKPNQSITRHTETSRPRARSPGTSTPGSPAPQHPRP